MQQNFEQLARIFHQREMEKRDEVKEKNLRFVHYTSPEAAMKMIQNNEVWMRKSSTMNDFSEIEHGLACLEYVWGASDGRRFRAVLENCFPGLSDEVEAEFRQLRPHLQQHTYLTCISEHLGGSEDEYGRLSMWRAYGGIGIVLNPAAFMLNTDALETYSSPVNYRDIHSFSHDFSALVDRVESQQNFIAAQDRQSVQWVLSAFLRVAVLCTKHPAFVEEKEWRIFHSPTYRPSKKVTREVEVVRGIPQLVCKIRLNNDPEAGLTNIEVHELVDRIIIGPTPDPMVQAEAFMMALHQKGVQDAGSRVFVTNIPLRQ